ncbi:unnamed protein product [Paramecium pentaurelia]|uniref:Uncharacterized protein n=1 Tax=Paramecium pentaurelia TaxID=43138 RepID=A0A8S1YI65_9CILI|nr:unnamed protein product [Paramecium pentaurelia]
MQLLLIKIIQLYQQVAMRRSNYLNSIEQLKQTQLLSEHSNNVITLNLRINRINLYLVIIVDILQYGE